MSEQTRTDLIASRKSELYEAIIRFGSYCYCGFWKCIQLTNDEYNS